MSMIPQGAMVRPLSSNQYTRSYGAPVQQLRPEFYMDPVRDEAASAQAGREIYREVERVKIIVPGATQATVVVKNVSDVERNRWPDEYRAWRAGQEMPLSGTPIEHWPLLNSAQVKMLRAVDVRSVEEVARLSDVHVQGLVMGGMSLREQARAWLDNSEYTALVTRLTAANDVLQSRLAALEAHNANMAEAIQQLQAQLRPQLGLPHPFQSYISGDHDPLEAVRQPWQNSAAVATPAADPFSSFATMPPIVRRMAPATPGETP